MWYYLYIDDPATAHAASSEFQKAIFAVWAVTDNYDATVFCRLDGDSGGVHYYFTPAAKSVALVHGASPCEKPSRQEVGEPLCEMDGSVIHRLLD